MTHLFRARQVALIGALLVALFLAQPAWADTKVDVTYRSTPTGASLYENGKFWGHTPVTLTYKADGKFKSCERLKPLSVRWISGAEAALDDVTVCPENGKQQEFSFVRPTGVPDELTDMLFALELLQLRLASLDAAYAANQRWLDRYTPPVIQTRERQRNLRCTSRVIGYSLITDCTER